MTLAEFHDAVDGHNEQREDDYNNDLYLARLISFYAVVPHAPKKARIKKPSDLFEHPTDKEARRNRLKKLKPIQKVFRNGKHTNG